MGFIADVREVLIASPGDVGGCREAARDVIRQWNEQDGKARKLLLLPRMWEHHTYPTSQSNGQEAINKQLLPDCDFAIALFGNKLGTETERFPSGTVEEIEQMKTAGRQVMIYFSSAPVDRQARNNPELDRLEAFQKECQNSAYYATYSDVDDFRGKLTQHLRNYMNDQASKVVGIAQAIGADFTAPQSPSLPEFAKQMLVETAQSRSGVIHKLGTMSGPTYQIGTWSITAKTAREKAKFEEALEILVDNKMLRHAGKASYEMTEKGFRMADKLQSETPS